MELTLEQVIIRFLLAILIGGLIGLERDYKNSAAGFRTHILVCIGSVLISLIQLNMAKQAMDIIEINPQLAEVIKIDFARLGAQVITGVGFLGAGTIIYTKGSIRGLTTAASLWVVAGLGLAIGMGYYEISIIAAIAIFITLVILKKFQSKFVAQMRTCKIEIIYLKYRGISDFVESILAEHSIRTDNVEFIDGNDESSNKVKAIYYVSIPKFIEANEVINNLSVNDSIISVESK